MKTIARLWGKFGNFILVGIIAAMAVLQPHVAVSNPRVAITFGSGEARAAGTADYSLGLNGTANAANLTTALNALPSQGGLFHFKVGTYNISSNSSGNITRAFGNMTIEGEGKGTFFTGNGTFVPGGSNWVFSMVSFNFLSTQLPQNATWNRIYTLDYPNGVSKEINGVYVGLNLTGDILPTTNNTRSLGSSILKWLTGWFVNLNAETLNATQVNGVTGNFSTLNAPTGRGATYVIAASNAPIIWKNQADYVMPNSTADLGAAVVTAQNGSGLYIKLSPGNFTVTTELILQNTTILEGVRQQTILMASANINIGMIRNANFGGQSRNTSGYGITVRNLIVNTNNASQTKTVSPIVFNNVDNSTIENCYFIGSVFFPATELYTTEVGSSGATSACTFSWCKGNKYINNTFTGMDYAGLDISYTSGFQPSEIVYGNTFENLPAKGLYQIAGNTIVSNNIFRNIVTTGWDPHGNGDMSTFTGNTLYNVVLGISISANGEEITGNTFDKCGQVMEITSGSYNKFNNNIVRDAGNAILTQYSTAGNYNSYTHNIFFGGDTWGLRLIVGNNTEFNYNTLVNDGIYSFNYGVQISAGCTNTTIIGNNFPVCSTSVIADAGTNTRIQFNPLGYVTENSGNATLAANTSIVTVTHGLATTPTWVGLTSTSNLTQWIYVSGVNATSFNITSSVNVTSNTTLYWRATVGAGN